MNISHVPPLRPKAFPPLPKEVSAEFGTLLRHFRRHFNMTQDQLADACQINRGYLSELEHSHHSPSLDILLRLSDALGIHPACLLPDRELASPDNT